MDDVSPNRTVGLDHYSSSVVGRIGISGGGGRGSRRFLSLFRRCVEGAGSRLCRVISGDT